MPKEIDISGRRFGKWLAIKKTRGGRPRGAIWLCKCECGTEREVPAKALLGGKSTNCGCWRVKDISGKTFGYWTALARTTGTRGEPLYLCICKCGTQKLVQPGSLKNGATTSCGCRLIKHGKSKTREHKIWCGMNKRCYSKYDHAYPRYGGRCITVCDRWRTSFQNFLEDMGLSPDGSEIDRIDNDGNYSPENCRWATPQQQSNNRRSNSVLIFRGRSQTLQQWANESGINRRTISARLKKGWSVERAITVRPR